MRAAYEHTDTARMLLDRGANMDAKSNVRCILHISAHIYILHQFK